MTAIPESIKLYLDESTFGKAIIRDDVEMIKYLISIHIEIPEDAMHKAIRYGRPGAVKYFHEELHLPWNAMSIDLAAGNGYVDIIKYVYSKGAECTDNAIYHAARINDFEMVKFLHKEMGVVCTSRALTAAARNGHLGLVKYLHSKGAKCTLNAIDNAIEMGNTEVVNYLETCM